jgi:acyl-CoA reductase-like NAD-dependent aldehyde dehydrogenase
MQFNLDNILRKEPYPLLIDGKEVASREGRTFETLNPANGRVIAKVYEADEGDVNAAVAAARRAYEGSWGKFTPKERSKALLRLAAKLAEHSELMSQLEVLDVGKPIAQSRASIVGTPATLEYYASVLLTLSGETINVSDNSLIDFTLREPLGMCGLILPWNYPVSLAILKLAPALAAGNTVVIKPSEVTPLSSVEMGRAILEAGLPEGVVNIINGPGATTGMALVRHPDVAKISFTGGTLTGRTIFREAAETVKRLTLELGGKSPLVVFDDADISKAVGVAYADITRNTGQVCAACTRLIVQESVADAFLDALTTKLTKVKVGDPQDEATEMGPIVNQRQMQRINDYLKIGADEGARPQSYLDFSGRKDLEGGYFVPPVLFHDAESAMRVAREEIFGPVQTVIRFKTEEDAVRIANDSPYGLAAAVMTRDAARGLRMARSVQAGTVCINHGAKAAVDAPFGGYKQSGIGKERGIAAMLDDTQIKNVRFSVV